MTTQPDSGDNVEPWTLERVALDLLVNAVRTQHPEDFDGPDTLANVNLRTAVKVAENAMSGIESVSPGFRECVGCGSVWDDREPGAVPEHHYPSCPVAPSEFGSPVPHPDDFDALAFRDSLAEGLVAADISEAGNPAQRDASHLIGWMILEGYRVSHVGRDPRHT